MGQIWDTHQLKTVQESILKVISLDKWMSEQYISEYFLSGGNPPKVLFYLVFTIFELLIKKECTF